LREAMRGRLPEEIRARRGKAFLSAPFEAAVTGRQRHWLDEGVALAKADRSGVFDAVEWDKMSRMRAPGTTFRRTAWP
jgi:hypothetical protein